MRIDKYLCDTLNMTRSEARKHIASGRVRAGETVIRNASFQIDLQTVFYDGQPLFYQRYFYIMLNKPKGYVCANSDAVNKTVFDLLSAEYRRKNLFVCGRLDKDSTGLVLITNDGNTAHRLLSPKNRIFKEYRVVLERPVSEQDILCLKDGVTTRNGVSFLPALFVRETENSGLIRIYEGKFHEIKRMFAVLENRVVALHRISIHGLVLDSALKEGEYRYLNAEEIRILQRIPHDTSGHNA